MYNAIQIADYAVAHCIDTEHPISNLQLNKILYFIQKHFLSKNSKGLFEEDFEAWQFGPVVPDVYYKYCSFGGMRILTKPQQLIDIEETKKKEIIKITNEKSILNPWELVSETHKKGSAWDIIYNNGQGNHKIIPKKLIKDF